MKGLLAMAFGIDALNKRLSVAASIAVMAAAMISALNAFVRYGFNYSSNAWLEIQWYLFAVTVMLGAPYVLRLNEHVRVDLVYGRLKGNRQIWVDLFGLIFFLLPVTLYMIYLSWPFFMKMYTSGEVSPSAGGLIRWPAMLTIPLGFALVSMQGCSEVIKRVAHLRGQYTLDTHYEKPLQ